MEEHKTKMDVEREHKEVRRIFASVNGKQMRESLRELEKDECKQIREGKSRTIYEVGDIANSVKDIIEIGRRKIEQIDSEISEEKKEEDMERSRLEQEKRVYELILSKLKSK